MNEKRRKTIHVWASGITPGTGGIQGWSRALIEAIATVFPELEVEVFVKNDRPGDSNFKMGRVRMSGGLPARLRSPAFFGTALLHGLAAPPLLALSTHLHFLPVMRFLKKWRNVPCICLLHGLEVWKQEPGGACARAARDVSLLANSRFTRDAALRHLGARPDTVPLLPCTFDEERFKPGPRPPHLLAKHGLSPDQPVLFTVSRLEKTERLKGHARVIEALPVIAQVFPDVRYIIGGKGDMTDELKAAANACGVTGNVIFTGAIAPEELADYYRLCDVFVMPSRKEGFGIVFLEALACGRPVVAGDRDGSVDALADGALGSLVDPDSASAIAGAVLSILQRTVPDGRLLQPDWLHAEVLRRFGREAFHSRVRALLSPLLS